jgi:hypothetical protein
VPPPTASRNGHREEGTASVELIAAVPFLLLAIVVAAQLALAGGALWAAEIAARAGARAALVGGDARAAARRALPSALRAEAEVKGSRPVAVRIRVPRLIPGMPELVLTAKSDLGDE